MSKPFYDKGRYVCEVTDHGINKAKTGTKQFVLRVKVLGKPDTSNPENYIPVNDQYERTIFRAITEKTIEYVSQDLETLGFQGSSFSQLDHDVPGGSDFRGQIIDCFCTIENDQEGNPRERWNLARKGGDFAIENKLEQRECRELDMLFGKHLKGKSAKVSEPVRATRNNAPPSQDSGFAPSDEDIPF